MGSEDRGPQVLTAGERIVERAQYVARSTRGVCDREDLASYITYRMWQSYANGHELDRVLERGSIYRSVWFSAQKLQRGVSPWPEPVQMPTSGELADALRRLTPKQRRALGLRLSGESNAAIADLLGVTESAVSRMFSRISRAIGQVAG